MSKFSILFLALIATTALWASNVITYTASSKLKETIETWSVGLHTNAFNVAISDHSFANGTGTITFAGEVTSIGNNAFYRCSSLTSITIPNSVTCIGSSTFSQCTELNSIIIPNSVIRIEMSAFSECTSLSSVTIPESVTHIGKSAFSYCRKLSSITINNGVTSIGNNAFSSCSSLTSITIPNSVTSIGDDAFHSCSSLTSVTIGNSVDSIGTFAFSYCTGLKSITIPQSVTSIGHGAFNACDNIKSVVWNAKKCNGYTFNTQVNSFVFGDSVEVIPTGICRYMNLLDTIIIPNSVTRIENNAFGDCCRLGTVIIPNSVTSIEEKAFDNVFNIIYSGTATGSPWGAKSIGGYKDGYWVYEDTTRTNLYACSAKAKGEVCIPASVTNIKDYAFKGCDSITSVRIPSSLTKIGKYVFENCKSLKDVTIPNTITSIGDYAFHYCISLKSVTIPNSVTTLYGRAFENCDSLTFVTIGNGMKSIGREAFCLCSNIQSITCYAITPPSCESSCFSSVSKYATIYVPAISVSAYKAATVWKDFMKILPIGAYKTETAEIQAKPTSTFVDITWPVVEGADNYTIEVKDNGQVICTFVFDTVGNILNYNYTTSAPARHRTYAEQTSDISIGWTYTIYGLTPGVNYTYSVVAKNASGTILDTKNGSFSTTHTALDQLSDSPSDRFTKIIKDGQLYLLRNGKTYNAQGGGYRTPTAN